MFILQNNIKIFIRTYKVKLGTAGKIRMNELDNIRVSKKDQENMHEDSVSD